MAYLRPTAASLMDTDADVGEYTGPNRDYVLRARVHQLNFMNKRFALLVVHTDATSVTVPKSAIIPDVIDELYVGSSKVDKMNWKVDKQNFFLPLIYAHPSVNDTSEHDVKHSNKRDGKDVWVRDGNHSLWFCAYFHDGSELVLVITGGYHYGNMDEQYAQAYMRGWSAHDADLTSDKFVCIPARTFTHITVLGSDKNKDTVHVVHEVKKEVKDITFAILNTDLREISRADGRWAGVLRYTIPVWDENVIKPQCMFMWGLPWEGMMLQPDVHGDYQLPRSCQETRPRDGSIRFRIVR